MAIVLVMEFELVCKKAECRTLFMHRLWMALISACVFLGYIPTRYKLPNILDHIKKSPGGATCEKNYKIGTKIRISLLQIST